MEWSHMPLRRFHIVDACCGTVETCSTKQEAVAHARSHLKRHLSDIRHATVYDTKAKRTHPNEWQVHRSGEPKEISRPPAGAETYKPRKDHE